MSFSIVSGIVPCLAVSSRSLAEYRCSAKAFKMKLILIVFAFVLIAACSKAPDASEVRRYVKFSELSSDYTNATNKVINQLIAEGENPIDYFVLIEYTKSTDELLYIIVHKDTFLRKNQDHVGNPSGKDRFIHYSLRTGTVSRSLFAQ